MCNSSKASSIDGYIDWSKVWYKFSLSVCQFSVPQRSSISTYQYLGLLSKVCTNKCTHSSLDLSFHASSQFRICEAGPDTPSYNDSIPPILAPNLISSSLRQVSQVVMFCWCAVHHLPSVALNTTTRCWSLSEHGSCASYSWTKTLTSDKPSKIGSVLTSDPI